MAGYGDDAAFDAWMTANGYSLPDSAPSPAVLRQRGSAYLDGTYGQSFVGFRADGYAQERAWPRKDAILSSGETVPEDVVPQAIIEASYEAAVQEAMEPGSLSAIGSQAERVKREKVGDLEQEFAVSADAGARSLVTIITDIEGLVAPFLASKNVPAVLVV